MPGERTIINHEGGGWTRVETDSRGQHNVTTSEGGGGQYGSDRTHKEVVQERTTSQNDKTQKESN